MESANQLFEQLYSQNIDIKISAIESLAKTPSRIAFEEILPLVSASDSNVKAAAQTAILKLAKQFPAWLDAALDTAEPELKQELAPIKAQLTDA